jgi:hypothetical protein
VFTAGFVALEGFGAGAGFALGGDFLLAADLDFATARCAADFVGLAVGFFTLTGFFFAFADLAFAISVPSLRGRLGRPCC